MKKHILLFSNLIIVIAIIIGFVGIVYKDTKAYQNLAEKHLENIVSLSDVDISNHIENSMTKPVMVSKTMANDEFLKEWLVQEPKKSGDSTYLNQLYSYLKTYKEKYNYTTIFCISAQTEDYYYQDGLNKTISNNDEHDIWYYNFIESGKEYDLQVDKDQTDGNGITVFVNFRVVNSDGSLLGVIGVGLQVDTIEDLFRSYENDYDLSIYIVNVGGSQNSFTGSTDNFVTEEGLKERTNISDKIELNQSDDAKIQWYTADGKRKCLITKYNQTLGWYLVLEKDTSSINKVFQDRVEKNIVFMLISLVACIVVTTAVFLNYNRRIIKMENADELTGLSNAKLFSKQYAKFLRKYRNQKKTMFMLDIDHFKNINDTYGHIFGNTILTMIGKELQKVISGYGIAARWGGDEFIGVMNVDAKETEQILNQYMNIINMTESCHVTVSIGVSEIEDKLSKEQVIEKVDEALYCSKESGRNQITIV